MKNELPVYPCDVVSDANIIDPYEFFKNDGTTELQEVRGAESTCGVFPINNDVIIKLVYNVQGILLRDVPKLKKETTPISREVVAVSEHSKLCIGDFPIVNMNDCQMIDVPNNNMTVDNIIDAYERGYVKDPNNQFKDKTANDKMYSMRSYKMVEYITVNAALVRGFVPAKD